MTLIGIAQRIDWKELYPIDTSQYEYFKEAMEKISLSDSSLTYEYETSQALGFWLICILRCYSSTNSIIDRTERIASCYFTTDS